LSFQRKEKIPMVRIAATQVRMFVET